MNTKKKLIREGEGYQALKGKSTIGEILETASSFERTAFTFYSALREKVSNHLQPLVQELVDEEKHHFELFQGLGKHPHVQNYLAELIDTPTTDEHFSDYIQLPDLGEFPDAQTIIQYAMGREQAAMEQYSILAKETPPGPLQDLFYYLAHEELQHKKELEKRYYELIQSDND